MPTNLLLGAERPHKPIHKTKLPALKGIIFDNTTPTSRSQNTSPAVTIISTNRQQAYSAKIRGNKSETYHNMWATLVGTRNTMAHPTTRQTKKQLASGLTKDATRCQHKYHE